MSARRCSSSSSPRSCRRRRCARLGEAFADALRADLAKRGLLRRRRATSRASRRRGGSPCSITRRRATQAARPGQSKCRARRSKARRRAGDRRASRKKHGVAVERARSRRDTPKGEVFVCARQGRRRRARRGARRDSRRRARRRCRFRRSCAGARATRSSCGRCTGWSCCTARASSRARCSGLDSRQRARAAIASWAPARSRSRSADDYERALRDEGRVIADFDARARRDRRGSCRPRRSAAGARLGELRGAARRSHRAGRAPARLRRRVRRRRSSRCRRNA